MTNCLQNCFYHCVNYPFCENAKNNCKKVFLVFFCETNWFFLRCTRWRFFMIMHFSANFKKSRKEFLISNLNNPFLTINHWPIFDFLQDFTDSSWPLTQPDLAKITNIQVQCEKTSIRVNVDFDRPFYGMVFSKGHFSDPNCVHLQSGSGATSTVFEIQMNQCGMTASGGFGSDNGQPNPAGSFIESTIIVQYDPLVQEVWDQARKLRCTWYDYYEKSVTFRPFQVS